MSWDIPGHQYPGISQDIEKMNKNQMHFQTCSSPLVARVEHFSLENHSGSNLNIFRLLPE